MFLFYVRIFDVHTRETVVVLRRNRLALFVRFSRRETSFSISSLYHRCTRFFEWLFFGKDSVLLKVLSILEDRSHSEPRFGPCNQDGVTYLRFKVPKLRSSGDENSQVAIVTIRVRNSNLTATHVENPLIPAGRGIYLGNDGSWNRADVTIDDLVTQRTIPSTLMSASRETTILTGSGSRDSRSVSTTDRGIVTMGKPPLANRETRVDDPFYARGLGRCYVVVVNYRLYYTIYHNVQGSRVFKVV